jgi:hypothetical protein
MTDEELRALVRQAAITITAAIFQAADTIASAANDDIHSDPMATTDAVEWAASTWKAAGEAIPEDA